MEEPKLSIGAVIGSGALLVLGLSMLGLVGAGPGITVFVLGIIGLGGVGLALSLGRAMQSALPEETVEEPAGLREQLVELDELKADGVLNATEHRAKRKQLIDAWGGP